MARIVFPTTFNGWCTLYNLMIAKNDLDGAASILLIYFAQHNILEVTDKLAVKNAGNDDVAFQALVKLSEKLHEQCITKLDPIFLQHKAMVQMLKKFYSNSIHTLGDYGITVSGNKITYPKDRTEICTAIAALINHSNSLAVGVRPITALYLTQNQIDLVANLAALPTITSLDAQAKQAEKDSETDSQNRDVTIAPVIAHTRGIGNFIVSQYTKTPKSAGDWGYVIDDSPQDAVETVSKFKFGQDKTVYQVQAGSIIQVTGAGTLSITKGAEGTGTPIVLKAGDVWKVATGYTVLKAVNLSLTLTSALTYMKN